MLGRQQQEDPIHRWPVLEVRESDEWSQSYQTVGQFMATDLFTVRPDDLVGLASSVITWRHIRHVPVEDDGDGWSAWRHIWLCYDCLLAARQATKHSS